MFSSPAGEKVNVGDVCVERGVIVVSGTTATWTLYATFSAAPLPEDHW
jgi:hypothetical protein